LQDAREVDAFALDFIEGGDDLRDTPEAVLCNAVSPFRGEARSSPRTSLDAIAADRFWMTDRGQRNQRHSIGLADPT